VPVFYTIVVTFLLCIPGDALPDVGDEGIPNLDKAVHVLLFAGLSFTWFLYVKARHLMMKNVRAFQLSLLFFLAASSFGLLMEFVQRDFIPHRSFDWLDVLADACGALVGSIVASRIREQQ